MPSTCVRIAAGVLLLTAGLSRQVQAATASDDNMDGMAMQAPGSVDAEMRSGMQRMQNNMRNAPTTGDADHDFVAMMLPHHEGAVSMAKVELQHGRDPSLLKLARDIVAAQNREIIFMKAWLAAHPARAGAAH